MTLMCVIEITRNKIINLNHFKRKLSIFSFTYLLLHNYICIDIFQKASKIYKLFTYFYKVALIDM